MKPNSQLEIKFIFLELDPSAIINCSNTTQSQNTPGRKNFLTEDRGRKSLWTTRMVFKLQRQQYSNLNIKDLSSVPTLKSCACGSPEYHLCVHTLSQPQSQSCPRSRISSAGRYQTGVMQ